MSVAPPERAAVEWQRHWPVVLAATAGVAMSTMNTYSAGLFIAPFEQAFGWTRAQIASGPAIAAITTVIVGPFMGAAVDHFGPRRIGIIGLTALCLLTALLGATGPGIWSYRFVWLLLALINGFIVPTVWTAAVTSLFSSGRGFALAVTLCGSGIGSLITPVLTYALIEHFGWRLALVGLGASWGVTVLPLILLCFTSVKDGQRTGRMARATPDPAGMAAGRRDLV